MTYNNITLMNDEELELLIKKITHDKKDHNEVNKHG